MASKASSIALAEQLARLAKLHADGSISEADFRALKAKLITGVGASTDQSEARERNRRGINNAPDEQTAGTAPVGASKRKRTLAPSLGVFGVIGIIVVAAGVVMLGNRDGNRAGIDCGSPATKNLVIQIAKEHPDITFSLPANIVQSMLGVQSKAGLGSRALINSSEEKAIIAHMEVAMRRICAPLGQGTFELRCRSGLSPELSRDAEYQALQNQDRRLFEKAKRETTFALETIRMDSKDANTKAVSCTAESGCKFSRGHLWRRNFL